MMAAGADVPAGADAPEGAPFPPKSPKRGSSPPRGPDGPEEEAAWEHLPPENLTKVLTRSPQPGVTINILARVQKVDKL